jgi:hypothetical protein
MSVDEKWIYVRSVVEHPGGLDEEWFTYLRAEWEAMTAKEQEKVRTEYVVDHQNNVAPCGASEVDDAEEIPGDVLDDPEGYRL